MLGVTQITGRSLRFRRTPFARQAKLGQHAPDRPQRRRRGRGITSVPLLGDSSGSAKELPLVLHKALVKVFYSVDRFFIPNAVPPFSPTALIGSQVLVGRCGPTPHEASAGLELTCNHLFRHLLLKE